jgi:hypothetical protein
VKLAVYLEILRGGENNQRERKKIRPFFVLIHNKVNGS